MAIETERFANTSNNNRMYREQLITREDLDQFRALLLGDLKSLLEHKTDPPKKWLKSSEVRKMLNISPGTLQTLRINRILSYTHVGGTIYYAAQDIEKVLQNNKVSSEPTLFNAK